MMRLPHRACLILSLLLMAAGPVAAAPEGAETARGDAVLSLLKEKGLLPNTAQLSAQIDANPMVQQVRDTATDLVLSAMNFLGVRYLKFPKNLNDPMMHLRK